VVKAMVEAAQLVCKFQQYIHHVIND